ncbi:MAG TPA: helix-turn-helix domain-containing protein [Hanamia sp.]
MGKRFSLLTEYNESDLRQIISELLSDLLEKYLSKTSPYLNNSPPLSSIDPLLTRSDVCKILHITLPTLSKLQDEGKIKATIVGGSYRYSKKNITAFISGKE